MIWILVGILLVTITALIVIRRKNLSQIWLKNKKKIAAIALGSSIAVGGLAGVPSFELDIEDNLISSIEDYTLLGYDVSKIDDPVIYESEVLCEAHLPLAFTFEDLSKDIVLDSQDKNNFISASKIDVSGFSDLELTYKMLVKETYSYQEASFSKESFTDKKWDENKSTFISIESEREIVSYNTVNDYRYIWKEIKSLDEISFKKGDTVIIDVTGNFKAGLNSASVDIVPTISFDSYSKTYSEYAWWNSNWNYRKNIVLESDYVDSALNNFVVCINVTDTDLRDHAQNNGNDIAFVNEANDTQYKHEIEYYNGATGQLLAWVNISSLSHTADTKLNIYYGNAGAGDQQDKTGTWATSYLAVYHLNDTDWLDSTSNNNDLTTSSAPSLISTYWYQGADFHEDNLVAATLLDAATDYLTFEYIFLIDENTETEFLHFWKKSSGDTYLLPGSRYKDLQGYVKLETVTESILTVGDLVQQDNFYYSGFTMRGDNYLMAWLNNGVAINESCNSWDAGTTTDFEIGGPTYDMEGTLEEIRVSKVVRSNDWMETSYDTLFHAVDGEFFTFGPETTDAPSPSTFSVIGLPNDNVTWHGNQGDNVWCNGTGTFNETLRAYMVLNATQEVTQINVYMENMTDGSGNWYGASNITIYASSDNASFGVPNDNSGIYLNGGSNISLNTSTWNIGTMGTDPFIIENGTTDTIYIRFKASISASETTDRTYFSSENKIVWAKTFAVYFMGNNGV